MRDSNTTIELNELASSGLGFIINGAEAYDGAGWSVGGAGDVNGDGKADLIIGAPDIDAPNYKKGSGQGYVVFGNDYNNTIELNNLGTNGYIILGVAKYDNLGMSVSGAGDVNGDGKDDLIIGAPSADLKGRFNSGQSYVVFGKSNNNTISLHDLGADGFSINGATAFDSAGSSVSGAGDVNGDGKADLIIGAPAASRNGKDSGQSYVVFGKSDSSTVDLHNIGSGGFIINGVSEDDRSGFSVSGAGDVNGDGKDDLIIGAPYANPNGKESGQSYVVFGKSDNSTVELNDLGSGGFVINGAAAHDGAGFSVSGAGDVNGDGKADLIIGAIEPEAISFNKDSGTSYVVFGKSDSGTVELNNLGAGGFIISGAAKGDHSGFSVSSAGDVNGDGKADLIIGAPYADPNGKNSGRSYVVFGKSDNGTVELNDLGSGGLVINGAAADDWSGYSVSGAGDVNGDGTADLIIGAPFTDSNGEDSGRSYVVFGNQKTLTSSQSISSSTLAWLISASLGGLLLLLVLGLYYYKRRATMSSYSFFRPARAEQITEIEMDIRNSSTVPKLINLDDEEDNKTSFSNSRT